MFQFASKKVQKRLKSKKPRAVDVTSLERALRNEVDGEVRFDHQSRALYAADGSNYRQVPIGVVVPRSPAAVEKTVALCRKHGAPIVSRGAGTALAGQTCNTAVVIDFSKYLHRIVQIDPVDRNALVQPGTILDQLRIKAAREHRLTFGPDPATHNHCTLGGMIGNNSCGIHSVMAGRTVDNVEELEVLTYDGMRMRVGPTSEEELARIIAAGGRRGQIYRDLKALRDRYADLIRRKYPRIPRRVSGYNLDELLPERGFNVARALVGSEGTCVTVLEAKLRLVDKPKTQTLLVLGYPDVYSAGDHIPRILEFGPIGLEGIDDNLINYMEKKHLHLKDLKLLPDGGGWLLVEFGGRDKEESDRLARKAMKALSKEKNSPSMKLYDDLEEEEQVWEIRESGLGATAFVPGMPLCWPGWEDAAVPPERVGDYLRDFRGLLEKHDYEAALYGHFGQGCIHCRISFDLMTYDGIRTYLRFVEEASGLVESYGGSFSGEHGDGQSRAMFLPKMYGDELMEAFREFKEIWDPDWKMNPGKVIDAHRSDENLRLGTDYNPWQPETHFRFPQDEGSFPRASLRCVGVGKCRRPGEAFMCPSFIATREEKDTTRGRAHLIFEMFRGDFIKDGWRSKEVKDSLDLCLACKGCKTECPVNVDMATYKAEFLSHYYQGRMRPRDAYGMGLIGFWGEIGSRFPATANFLSHATGVGGLAKKAAGVHRKRELPKFAAETFLDWFALRPDAARGERGEVVLYPDTFNNHFHPNTLKAAVEVLERWGYRVRLPEGRPPSIRPMIHYGMLDLAKGQLLEAVEQLRSFVTRGVPVICLEPSTLSVFREELSQLYPEHRDGQRVQQASFLLSEFIEKEELEVPILRRKAVYHAHCHQKAVLDPKAARRVLEKMGIEVEEPEEGCCGMAGSFGFEERHYEVSMRIGEENLLPAVRRAGEETLVIADGFSCRTQIGEGAGRTPLHLSEALLMAFEQGPEGPAGPRPEASYVARQTPMPTKAQLAMTGAVVGGLAAVALMKKWRS